MKAAAFTYHAAPTLAATCAELADRTDNAKVMGGGGGGRPEMAQAGGKQPEKVDEALNGVPNLVRQGLS